MDVTLNNDLFFMVFTFLRDLIGKHMSIIALLWRKWFCKILKSFGCWFQSKRSRVSGTSHMMLIFKLVIFLKMVGMKITFMISLTQVLNQLSVYHFIWTRLVTSLHLGWHWHSYSTVLWLCISRFRYVCSLFLVRLASAPTDFLFGFHSNWKN